MIFVQFWRHPIKVAALMDAYNFLKKEIAAQIFSYEFCIIWQIQVYLVLILFPGGDCETKKTLEVIIFYLAR